MEARRAQDLVQFVYESLFCWKSVLSLDVFAAFKCSDFFAGAKKIDKSNPEKLQILTF